MTILYSLAGLVLFLFVLWLTGRRWVVREIATHQTARDEVVQYHNYLVQYAESRGSDASAMNELVIRSSRIENLLGADNWIAGARVVRNIYNGVPAIPFAIREIHQTITDYLWQREAFQAVELVRNLLVRHVGRREDQARQLVKDGDSPVQCIALGWRLWTAIPLYLLNAFGLIGRSTVRRARNSAIFSVYSFTLFLAALAAPAFAYLADRQQIESELRNLLR